jgi:Zn-dependent peptidase ImmA (M78 family)
MARPQIKRAVQELLAAPDGHVRPLPLESIARGNGIEVVRDPLSNGEDVSGFYYRDGTHRVIGVNSAHPRVRQRFTIAHELGHALLHDVEGVHLDRAFMFRDRMSSLAIDPKERDANAFAAELLMPEQEILDAVRQDGLDITDDAAMKRAAKRFGVSVQALGFRLANLGVSIDGSQDA